MYLLLNFSISIVSKIHCVVDLKRSDHFQLLWYETMFHNYFIAMEKKSNICKDQRQKKLFLFIFTLVQIVFKKWISLNQTLDIISNE